MNHIDNNYNLFQEFADISINNFNVDSRMGLIKIINNINQAIIANPNQSYKQIEELKKIRDKLILKVKGDTFSNLILSIFNKHKLKTLNSMKKKLIEEIKTLNKLTVEGISHNYLSTYFGKDEEVLNAILFKNHTYEKMLHFGHEFETHKGEPIFKTFERLPLSAIPCNLMKDLEPNQINNWNILKNEFLNNKFILQLKGEFPEGCYKIFSPEQIEKMTTVEFKDLLTLNNEWNPNITGLVYKNLTIEDLKNAQILDETGSNLSSEWIYGENGFEKIKKNWEEFVPYQHVKECPKDFTIDIIVHSKPGLPVFAWNSHASIKMTTPNGEVYSVGFYPSPDDEEQLFEGGLSKGSLKIPDPFLFMPSHSYDQHVMRYSLKDPKKFHELVQYIEKSQINGINNGDNPELFPLLYHPTQFNCAFFANTIKEKIVNFGAKSEVLMSKKITILKKINIRFKQFILKILLNLAGVYTRLRMGIKFNQVKNYNVIHFKHKKFFLPANLLLDYKKTVKKTDFVSTELKNKNKNEIYKFELVINKKIEFEESSLSTIARDYLKQARDLKSLKIGDKNIKNFKSISRAVRNKTHALNKEFQLKFLSHLESKLQEVKNYREVLTLERDCGLIINSCENEFITKNFEIAINKNINEAKSNPKIIGKEVIAVSEDRTEHLSSTGEVNLGNVADKLQSIITDYYDKPFPHRDQLIVDFEGKEKFWICLSPEEKFKIVYDHSHPHDRADLKTRDKCHSEAEWVEHIENKLFMGSHDLKTGKPREMGKDPRDDHGNDHAMRVALFSVIYACLYEKYDPTVRLNESDLITIQLAAAFHDSGRQTEGVDIDDKKSAENAKANLEKWGFKENLINESFESISDKDSHALTMKSLMAKCVQCGDSTEYGRIGKFNPAYLDIYKEFNGSTKTWEEEISPKKIKEGLTVDQFNEELKKISEEMVNFIGKTLEKRKTLAEADNYYVSLLEYIDPKIHPTMYKMLVEKKIIMPKHPIQEKTKISSINTLETKNLLLGTGPGFEHRYTGEYTVINSKIQPHGKGLLIVKSIHNNDMLYEGVFENGKFLEGSLTVKFDGKIQSIEKGKFKDNYAIEGEKIYHDRKIQIGSFWQIQSKLHDSYLKEGKQIQPNGIIEEGQFNEDGYLVQGKQTLPNGTSRVGYFDGDKFYGWETIVLDDKTKRTILFENGEPLFIDDFSSTIDDKIFNLKKNVEEALNKKINKLNVIDASELLRDLEKVAQWHIYRGEIKEALSLRMKAAKAMKISLPIDLLDSSSIEKRNSKFGLRIQPLDTHLIKNHAAVIQTRRYSSDDIRLRMDSNLTKAGRVKIQSFLDQIRLDPNLLFDALPKDFCRGISINEKAVNYQGRKDLEGKKWEGEYSTNLSEDGYVLQTNGDEVKKLVIEFEGVGKIEIGNSSNCVAEFKHLTIELNPKISENEASHKLGIMLSAMGLGQVSIPTQEEDTQRIKILQLFRNYYPKEAFELEQKLSTFQEPYAILKQKILEKIPNTEKEGFETDLALMYRKEIYPGQEVWAIKGLADKVKEKGGIGLMMGISGSVELMSKRLASILKYGSLSTQDRFQAGIIAAGASVSEDFATGGAGVVFTRMITNKMNMNPLSYDLAGDMQILFDLKLLERGGYAYETDEFGTKFSEKFKNRPSFIELAEKLGSDNTNNEVCLPNRVSPEYIKGIVVGSEKTKNELIRILRDEGQLSKNHLEQDCINGIQVENFIHVGEFKEKYWA